MQICAFGRTLFLSSIGNLILAIGNWYVLAICLTYKCNKVAASLEERLTLARNYRNEFILRYDNQRNVSTSFIGEFEVFLWLYLCFFLLSLFLFILFVTLYQRETCAHAHRLKIQATDKNNECATATVTQHIAVLPFLFLFVFVERQVSYRCGT